MKIIKLKELDLVNAIKNILNEQSGGSMLSNKGYEAILKFENTKGTPNAKLTGATSMGYGSGQVRSLERTISRHIESTITLDRWFKIDDLFRTQIYSFMFNADSGSTDQFKWLAGLAQSIDSSIDRAQIKNKSLNDPNVKNAVELVNKTIDSGKINNYYNQYKLVLKAQYKTITNSNQSTEWNEAAQKYSWSVRVDEIEDFYNGGGNTTAQQPVATTTKQQPTAATKQQPTQQPAAPKQQPAAAPAKQAASAAIGGVGFLELLEKVIDYSDYATAGKPDNMSIKINSPLVGDSIFFTIQEKIYGCTWDYDIKKPYYNDGMFLNLTRQNGKVTATVNTKGGQKIPASIDKMNCKSIQ